LLNPVDPNDNIRRCDNVLRGINTSLLHPCDILYPCISKKHKFDDNIESVAAVAAVILSSSFGGS